MGIVDELSKARAAFEQQDWATAFAALAATDPEQLAVDDLERLATAAFLLGRADESRQLLQRMWQLHVDAREYPEAAWSAFWLAFALVGTGDLAVGGGWIARAHALLDDHGTDVVERGYLLIHDMFRHVFSGEFPEALGIAERIIDYGRRFGDDQLLAMGLSSQGRLTLYTGRVREALALCDQAMAVVMAGTVTPGIAGHIYCTMIEGCQEIADFGRAEAWTAALTRWCDGQAGLLPFTGQCATHRGQIMSLHGAYQQALEEFAHARRRYEAEGSSPAAGTAWAEEGDVRRVLGDFTGAEQAYEQAIQCGHEPQPGLALLWLAQRRHDSAVAAVRRLLAEVGDPVHRSRILPAAVEILLADGQAVDDADSAAAELTGIAEEFGCAAVIARAAYAQASVALAQGDAAGALPYLRRAVQEWARLDAPYEVARCRLAIGRALTALGDADSARTEFQTARQLFSELDAGPAAREVAALLEPGLPGGLTEREVEVLRLVAAGRSNPEIAAALTLSEKTVARHLSNIFTKLDVSSRTAAAAFAYEQHLV
jgi:ATP/maltotriose-dependent transcriptional regulator MalT